MIDPESWQGKIFEFPDDSSASQRLLIEETPSLVSLHHLCVYGYIVSRGKNLIPTFLCSAKTKSLIGGVVSRYFPRYELVEFLPLTSGRKFGHLLFAARAWLGILLSGRLLDLKWNGMLIGDIVYDQYLACRQCATLHRRDLTIPKLIYQIVCLVDQNERLLGDRDTSAILLSHKVGASGAPMAAAAEKLSKPIYSLGGGRYGTLLCSSRRKDYEYRADESTLRELHALPEGVLEDIFQDVRKHLLEGAFNADAKFAFDNKVISGREEFARSFGLDPRKKNIFVMLHAFSDYPHSHFNGMIFDDFYDWFIRTLEHAFANPSVNWIIKEHPASHFYPVGDVDWDAIKRRYAAPHILFIDSKIKFNSLSIPVIGDAIITCLGSAGFEMSALGAIPSITASDNPYSEAGFALCPKTRQEYFEMLGDIAGIKKLDGPAQRRAKETFIYMHRTSRVEMLCIPHLGHADSREMQFDKKYFDRVESDVSGRSPEIKGQLASYIARVESRDFRILNTAAADLD